MSSYIGIKTIPFYDGTTRKTLSFTDTSASLLLPRIPAGVLMKSGVAIDPPGALTDNLAGAGAGNVDNGDHKYVVTLLTTKGETLKGTASGGVTVANKAVDGKVALTAIPTGDATKVVGRRIYRSKVGDLTTFFLLATILDNVTTTYTDNTADANLGAAPPTTDTSKNYRVARRPLKILVDTDQRVYIGFGVTAPTVTSAFQLLEIGERQIVDVPRLALYVAALRVSASGTLGFSYLDLNMALV